LHEDRSDDDKPEDNGTGETGTEEEGGKDDGESEPLGFLGVVCKSCGMRILGLAIACQEDTS